jgi:hypothetical protein
MQYAHLLPAQESLCILAAAKMYTHLLLGTLVQLVYPAVHQPAAPAGIARLAIMAWCTGCGRTANRVCLWGRGPAQLHCQCLHLWVGVE